MGKYFKYAIGEIILVVIGILIALQINNWNENRKDQIKLTSYRNALRAELYKEKQQIQEFLESVTSERQIFADFKKRILKSEAPLDTVFQIARYDFTPITPRIGNFNNNTYSVMLTTGEIDLFNTEIKDKLYSFYKNEKETGISMDEAWENYRDVITDFTKFYPVDVDFTLMNRGKINGILWEDIDKKQLASKFNAVTISRQNYLRLSLKVELLLPQIENLLKVIEK